MRDEAIKTPPGLTAAEDAVAYLIQRLKLDPDLRHHMLHTEALARVLVAESARTGVAAKEISVIITCKAVEQDPCQLLQCRRALTDIYNLAADCLDRGGTRASEALEKIQKKAESLCN